MLSIVIPPGIIVKASYKSKNAQKEVTIYLHVEKV
jgi:hypothetical protein